MNEKINTSALQRCTYTNVRRVDRVVARFFDEVLSPSGVSVAQFALLATLLEVAPVTINSLAEIMVIDRTTLTRNLALLSKKQFISCQEGSDRRIRLVHLTAKGEEAFKTAFPLWQRAQERIEVAFGRERFDALLTEMSAVLALFQELFPGFSHG